MHIDSANIAKSNDMKITNEGWLEQNQYPLFRKCLKFSYLLLGYIYRQILLYFGNIVGHCNSPFLGNITIINVELDLAFETSWAGSKFSDFPVPVAPSIQFHPLIS